MNIATAIVLCFVAGCVSLTAHSNEYQATAWFFFGLFCGLLLQIMCRIERWLFHEQLKEASRYNTKEELRGMGIKL